MTPQEAQPPLITDSDRSRGSIAHTFEKLATIGQRQKIEVDTTTIHTLDVPILTSEMTFWCGYTSLAMLMQFHGYTHLTPRVIFDYINRYNTTDKHPSFTHLARTGEELTNEELKADLWTTEKYAAWNRKRQDAGNQPITPFDLLDSYLLNNIPVMVRIPSHTIVAVGVDMRVPKSYIFNNPSPMVRRETKSFPEFGAKWKATEENYPDPSSFLMLAFRRGTPHLKRSGAARG